MIRLDCPVTFGFMEPVPYRVFIIPDAYIFVNTYSQKKATNSYYSQAFDCE